MKVLNQNNLLNEFNWIKTKIERGLYVKLDSHWKHAPQLSTANLFYMIVDGEAELCLNHVSHTMTPGNIYFIPKYAPVSFRCPEYFSKIYFYITITDRLGREISIAPPRGCVLTDRAEQIAEIKRLLFQNDFYSAYKIRLAVESLILEIIEQTGTNFDFKTYTPDVEIALNIITEAPHMSLTTPALAKGAAVSASTLKQHFRAQLGTTVNHLVTSTVLSATVNDLVSGTLSLQQISEKYGFCDQFYFSRLFSKQYGISPSKYRKEHII